MKSRLARSLPVITDDETPLPKRRLRARQDFGSLMAPKPIPDLQDIARDEWLDSVYNGFVATPQNKQYYRVLLETLWPIGHGIPGPLVTENQLREAIDQYRRSLHTGPEPYKNYGDPFRRMRELAGEEGVKGIAKVGKTYQLVGLNIEDKLIPRVHLDDENWAKVLKQFNNKCANCGRQEPEVRLQQDHKVPRRRLGGNELENWQPLCDECNNQKSTCCRGCEMDCQTCPWAFPEKFAPLRMTGENLERVRAAASKAGVNPHQLLNSIISDFFDAH